MRRLLLAVALCAAASPAWPHDWYTTERNAKGELCCSGLDCAPLAGDDVEERRDGFYIKSLALFVPHRDVQPSQDMDFHACVWGGRLRCFFAPPRGF